VTKLGEVFRKITSSPEVVRPHSGNCTEQYRRRSTERSRPFKATWGGLSRVVLDHAAESLDWLANHDIPESDIHLLAGDTTSDTDHQPKPDPFEGGLHLHGHCRSRVCASLARWQAGEHDLVSADRP
jgi:hypothetical protein